MASSGTNASRFAPSSRAIPTGHDPEKEPYVELLRAVKERCDPAGIMNPGKLLPPE